jgi:dinuclear metal center YbgI/SA1388 family protein
MGTSLTVKNLLANLDKIAAFGLAEKWDNVGLMLGDPDQEIQGILVALDPTEEVLAEAKECGADCIISHHPLIFTPLKAIYTNQPLGRFLRRALENEISVIGCHTNLDQAVGGVNDVLASSLGMVESSVLASCKYWIWTGWPSC